MFIKNFRLEITPKRVYSMLKTVEYKNKIKEMELLNLIEPLEVNKNQDDAKKVFNFLQNLEFIKKDMDDFFILNIDIKYLKNEKKFSDLMYDILIKQKIDKDFFEVSSWVMGNYKETITAKSAEKLAIIIKDFNFVNESYILNWRFWARFMGLGYIYDGEFIPNPINRLKLIIEDEELFKENETIEMKVFIDKILKECPILEKSIENNSITESLSLALSILNESNIIKLQYIQDSQEVWFLKHSALQEINKVSHIAKIGDNQ